MITRKLQRKSHEKENPGVTKFSKSPSGTTLMLTDYLVIRYAKIKKRMVSHINHYHLELKMQTATID